MTTPDQLRERFGTPEQGLYALLCNLTKDVQYGLQQFAQQHVLLTEQPRVHWQRRAYEFEFWLWLDYYSLPLSEPAVAADCDQDK